MAQVDVHEPGTPCWVELTTPDPEKARAFYAGLFGWMFRIGGADSGYYTTCLLDGAPAAGIARQQPGESARTAWLVYFAVDDADETVQAIRGHGGKVLLDPMDVMLEGRMAIAADPPGAVFGLWQPGRHPGAAVVDEPGAMSWRAVNTRQPVPTREFYAAVFGLEPRKQPGLAHHTLHRGDQTIALVLPMNDQWPADLPPHWMNYFGVQDAAEATAQVTRLGGTVFAQPFETPFGLVAVVADPMGAPFAVIQRTPGA